MAYLETYMVALHALHRPESLIFLTSTAEGVFR